MGNNKDKDTDLDFKYLIGFIVLTLICLSAEYALAAGELVVSAKGNETLHFIGSADFNESDSYEVGGEANWMFHVPGTKDVITLAPSVNKYHQFNRTTGALTHKLPVCDIPNAAVTHRNSFTVWVACGLSNQVLAYYLPNFDLATPINLIASPRYLSLSTLHKRLLVSFESGNRLAVINTDSQSLDSYLLMPVPVGMAFYGFDETSVWVTLPSLNQIRQLDASDFSLIQTVDTGEQMTAADVSPDGQWLAITHSGESEVWLVNLDEMQVSKISADHEMSWPAFSQDSQRLFVAATDDDEMVVIDVNTQQKLGAIPVAHDPVSRGRFAYREDPFLIFNNGFEGE